jgi:hypothetical protein
MAKKPNMNGHAKKASEAVVINRTNRNPPVSRIIMPGQPFRLADLVMNDQSTISRLALLQLMQGELPPLEIDKECRYKRILGIDDFQMLYDRMGICTRAVAIYPEESWKMSPDIYETEDLDDITVFEKQWTDMDEELHVLTNLATADEVSGIGHFGLVLLGFDDNLELNKPVAGLKADGTRDNRTKNLKLLYMRPVSQTYARISKFETDPKNPRYGQPTEYSIGFVNPTLISSDQPNPPQTKTAVHWTRVLHIADNRKDSNVFGVPRLRPVFNDGFNIQKVLGANGQGYWQGGFPGLSIETQAGIEAPDFDKEATKKDVWSFLNSQQRALFLEGLTARSLAPQVADPKSHFDTHLEALCICIGVPMRVFKGSEEGKMASTQDARNWNARVARRQTRYINPYILKEFFNRMFLVGALTRPQTLIIKWPDLNAPTEQDRATTASKITDALVKYLTGNVHVVMPPKEYLTIVLGYPVPLVEAVIKAAGAKLKSTLDKMVKANLTVPTPGSGAPGQPSQKKKLMKTKKSKANGNTD